MAAVEAGQLNQSEGTERQPEEWASYAGAMWLQLVISGVWFNGFNAKCCSVRIQYQ